jgi:DNA-directed RNA polymerase subunit RPC12/RpoP
VTNQRPCILCRPDNPNTAAPGWYACHHCGHRLAGQLGDLADRYATLMEADELIPHGSGERGSPGFGPRSPAVDALLVHGDPRTCWTSEHGYGALAVVTKWAKSIREDTTIDTPPGQMLLTVPQGRATMNRELATIRWNWHHVLAATWLADFDQEIRDVLRSLTMAGRLNDRKFRVGLCPVVVEEPVGEWGAVRVWPCGDMLTVRVTDDEIRCRSCGTVWPRSRWHELGDPWTDYAALSGDLSVPVGTLRRWCGEDGWETKRTGGRYLVARAAALASAQRRGRWTPAA